MPQNPTPPGRPSWPLPSPRVQERIRHGAEIVLTVQAAWLEEVDQLNVATSQVMGAPVVAAVIRRLNRGALLHWATSTIENPGAPVSRYISVDMQSSARELVWRGLTDWISPRPGPRSAPCGICGWN